ncbi:MAG: hypothetical protein ACKOQY_00805 [Bacteroidota bacterium]
MRFILSLVFILGVTATHLPAQKAVTTFGILLRPGFPSSYFRTGPISFSDSTTSHSLVQESGLSYGGVVRHEFDKRFSVESGIVYTRRNYRFDLSDGAYSEKGEYRIVAYEIPMTGLVTIQLGEALHMSAGLGASIDIYPSDVATSGDYYLHYSARKRTSNLALNAQLGAEWRSRKSGWIYLGFLYHRSASPTYTTLIEYYPNADFAGAYATQGRTELQGDYFGAELRYYFHQSPEKREERKRNSR